MYLEMGAAAASWYTKMTTGCQRRKSWAWTVWCFVGSDQTLRTNSTSSREGKTSSGTKILVVIN